MSAADTADSNTAAPTLSSSSSGKGRSKVAIYMLLLDLCTQ
jgi:hypothetical protein